MRLKWAKFGIKRKILRIKKDTDGSKIQQTHMRDDINKKSALPCCTDVANLAS